jgi:hypothetical protein
MMIYLRGEASIVASVINDDVKCFFIIDRILEIAEYLAKHTTASTVDVFYSVRKNMCDYVLSGRNLDNLKIFENDFKICGKNNAIIQADLRTLKCFNLF